MAIFLVAVALVSTFILGALSATFANGWFVTKDYLPAMLSLITTFFGAQFAFALNKGRDLEKEAREKLEAGNRAVVTLSRQHTRMVNIQKQSIDPIRNQPGLHIAFRPVPINLPLPSLDIDSLSFLIELDPNLLAELASFEETVFTAAGALKEHARIQLDEVQYAYEKANPDPKKDYTLGEHEAMLGPRLVGQLISSTSAVVGFVDDAVAKVPVKTEELSQALTKMFPGKTVVKSGGIVKQD